MLIVRIHGINAALILHEVAEIVNENEDFPFGKDIRVTY